MTAQDKATAALSSALIARGVDAFDAGDGVITVGDNVLVNVDATGAYVDVASVERDGDEIVECYECPDTFTVDDVDGIGAAVAYALASLA